MQAGWLSEHTEYMHLTDEIFHLCSNKFNWALTTQIVGNAYHENGSNKRNKAHSWLLPIYGSNKRNIAWS